MSSQLTKVQEMCLTSLTKGGKVNMLNRKPYRTPSQKAEAKRTAYKTKGGFFRSPAKVSYH